MNIIFFMLTGCYYYPWYSGPWLRRTIRRNDPPILGQYDNMNCKDIVIEHMEQMKSSKIDFAAVSWDPNFSCYNHVLDAAKATNMRMTVLYESLIHGQGKCKSIFKKSLDSIRFDMEDLLVDTKHPSWLRIDNKPVVMFYVTRNYVDIDDIFPAIREVLGDVFIVGDEIFWGKKADPKRLKHFDAVTSYNFYQPGRFEGKSNKEICDSFIKNTKECIESNLEICTAANIPYWPVAMPGYNDSKVRPLAEHDPIPRMDGYFFEQSLQSISSILNGDNALMVCSYSEWYEDTQIEPAGSYENLYLDILKEFVSKR